MSPTRRPLASPLRLCLSQSLPCLLLLLATGCSNDFDPVSRIKSLRVLAVRSEPVSPPAGASTTLSALVFTPDPAPSLTYAWSWCPFPGSASAGYPCKVTEADLAQLGGGVTIPPFDLGTGATASFMNGLPPEALQPLCAGVPGAPEVMLDCDGGFPVQIKLTVKSDSDEVTAVRTLRLPVVAAPEPSTNPTLEGLTAEVGGMDVPVDDAAAATLPRLANTVIKAAVPLEASETYTGRDDNDQITAGLHERLILSWFVESGDVDSPLTSYIAGQTPLEDATRNKWKPARTKDYQRGDSRLIVVLRDSRGGVSWKTGKVNLEPTP
jgi:hypothetical protein